MPEEQPPQLENNESQSITYKLAHLEEFLPGQPDILYDFAKFLSTRAHDELQEEGFDLMVNLAIYDLEVGKDGFTDKPIKGHLVGLPSVVYGLLRMQLQSQRIKDILYRKNDTDLET